MSTRRDAYEVLGVERGADDRQIKKRFRVVARELHPDVNSDPDAEEQFKAAAEAYEVLSDPQRRAVYDRHGWEGLDSRGYAPQPHGFGSFADIFDAFFGGDPFGSRGGGAPGPAQGGDIAVEAELTLDQAAQGAPIDLSFEAVEPCGRCHGNRAEPGTPIEPCRRCQGTGKLEELSRTAFGQLVRARPCDVCGGDGRIATTPCTECAGKGRRAVQRTLTVNMPAGISSGQQVRLSGRGHAGDRGGPSGDLYVVASVAEDPRFIRDESDLLSVVDISASTAALGTELTVATLDGDETIEVAAGTQPGSVVILRGRGMPQVGGGRRGDQRVVLNVIVPRKLDKRQRELLDELEASLTEENLAEPSQESIVSKLRRALR